MLTAHAVYTYIDTYILQNVITVKSTGEKSIHTFT